MPLYFFEFDGTVGQSFGIEFTDDAEAFRQARLAIPGIMHDIVSDPKNKSSMSMRTLCDIRNEDGRSIGRLTSCLVEEHHSPTGRKKQRLQIDQSDLRRRQVVRSSVQPTETVGSSMLCSLDDRA